MNLVAKYIEGLKKAYLENEGQEVWEHFERVKQGAEKEIIEKLKHIYPDVPNTLIDLLCYVDGTFWRKYDDGEVSFFILGSDIYEYPYYLLSSNEIIKNENKAKEYYSDYIYREYNEVAVDEKITNDAKYLKWLHFSDCMNNGGTSQLFIDFNPSKKGKKGQIIRFLHDPDEFEVIADNFDGFLEKLMENEYNFIHEDIMEF